MAKRLIFSCGCVQVIDVDIESDVTDSNLLPATDIHIIGLKIDGVDFAINEIFDSKQDFVSYLNTTFVGTYDIDVLFSEDDPYIQFESTEIETIEVMAILQTYQHIFKVGTPPDTVNKETIDVANGLTITNDVLVDEVLMVHIGSAFQEPITAIGWLHSAEDKRLSFTDALTDVHVYVTTKQGV